MHALTFCCYAFVFISFLFYYLLRNAIDVSWADGSENDSPYSWGMRVVTMNENLKLKNNPILDEFDIFTLNDFLIAIEVFTKT